MELSSQIRVKNYIHNSLISALKLSLRNFYYRSKVVLDLDDLAVSLVKQIFEKRQAINLETLVAMRKVMWNL